MSKKEKQTKKPAEPKNKPEKRDPAAEMEVFMSDQQPLFEEKLKIVIAIILVILFILLFIGIAWYFLTQVDTAFVNNSSQSSSVASFIDTYLPLIY